MSPASLAVLLAVAAGAGLVLGLYIGQLGRNRDLRELTRQRLEREQTPVRAFVRDERGELVEVDEDVTKGPILTEDERERMARDLMEESPASLTPGEARAEVDRILKEAAGLGHGHG